jgi:hypothetical protein
MKHFDMHVVDVRSLKQKVKAFTYLLKFEK